jgi:hypothetical protein
MRFRQIMSVIVFILLISGCDMQKNPSELMRAPVLSSDLNQLYNAITSHLPEGARIFIPLNSQSPVAIEKIDIDSDGVMEAYATYKVQKKYETNLGVMILKQSDNGWVKLDQVEFQGTEIDFIRFEDLAKDGNLELLFGSIEVYDSDKKMYLYSLENQTLSQIDQLPYGEVEVGNLNEDQLAEIIILRNNRYEMTAEASVYNYDGKSLIQLDTLPLDGTINGFSDVKIGKASSTQNGVFIEVGVGAHSAYSILLTMEDNKLKDVFKTSKPGGNQITFTAHSVFSKDINQDGIIEIPLLEELTPDASYAEMAFRTVWNRWDGNAGLVPVYYTYEDYDAGFSFDIPDSWKSNLQVERNYETGETTFYYVNKAGKKLAELASIRYYDKADQDDIEKKLKESNFEYIDLGTQYNRKFIGMIPDKLNIKLSETEHKQYELMKIDLDFLQKNFKLIAR